MKVDLSLKFQKNNKTNVHCTEETIIWDTRERAKVKIGDNFK